MKFAVVLAIACLVGCQSVQEKDALLLHDRVEKLLPLSRPKSINCHLATELSAPQAVKYRSAFPDETKLVDAWNVTYDWKLRPNRCEVHAQPLTPMTANQRAFLDEALCTLFQVFWAHSPFDGIRIAPADIVDQEDKVFLRQKTGSELGIYLTKKQFEIETHTAHKGIFLARYESAGSDWRPAELRHETMTFNFAVRDIQWSADGNPSAFWIYVGEQGAPQAHSHAISIQCE